MRTTLATTTLALTSTLTIACGGGGNTSDTLDEPDGGDDPIVDAMPIDYGDAGPSSGRQVKRPTGTTDAANGFLEYLPVGYDTRDDWPLLVFWHGIGENGDGSEAALDLVAYNGPPRLIRDNNWPAERPFVVLSPQHPGGGCPGNDEVRDFLAFAIETYDIDPDRVYLTGLSCGAIGAWNYMGQYVDEVTVAAFVPIAGDGGGAWGAQGCDLAKTPIWAFHGDADGVVLPGGDNTAMAGLAACAAPPALETKYTVYPGVGHDSWSATYDGSAGHDIYAWMLSKTRP
jgi:predicted peptidase